MQKLVIGASILVGLADSYQMIASGPFNLLSTCYWLILLDF